MVLVCGMVGQVLGVQRVALVWVRCELRCVVCAMKVLPCVVLCLAVCCRVVCVVVWHAEKSPSVDSKHTRVYVQNVPVCTGTTHTRAETHAGVVQVHTATF